MRHALFRGRFFVANNNFSANAAASRLSAYGDLLVGAPLLRLGVKCVQLKTLVAEKKHTSAPIAPLKQALRKVKIYLSKHKACAFLNRLNTLR